MCKNPYESGKNSYFNKSEFFASSTGKFHFDREGRERAELDAVGFQSHAIVSIMSNVRIYEDEEFAEPSLTSLICSSKAPTQLRSVSALDLMSSG